MKDSRKMPGMGDTSIAEQKQAEESLRQHNAYLAALHETSLDLINRLDLTDLLTSIVTRATRLVDTPHGYLYLINPAGTHFEVRVATGIYAGYLGSQLKLGEGLAGQVWQTGQPMRVDDYARWPQRADIYAHSDFHATAAAPLKSGDQVIGVIGVGQVEPGVCFSDIDLEILSRFAELASIALDNAKLYQAAQQDIAERKQAESRLQTIFETAPEAIVVVDLTTGLFTESNENAVKLYGLSHEELAKVGPADVSPPVQPDGRPSTEKALEQINAAVQGEAQVFEWIHRNARGEDIPCEVRLVRLPGNLPLVRASVTDITGRKQTEEARRASEERLRDITSSIGDWIWEVDSQGRYTYCSEKVVDVLGYTAEEILGKTPFDFMLPEEVGRIAPIFGEIVAAGKLIVELENWNLRKDGTKICLLTNGVPMRDAEGNLLGYRGVDKDITARKQAEEAVQASQRQLADIVTFLPDATLAIDKEGRVIIWNRAIEEMTGVPAAEMIGKGDYVYAIPFYGEARPSLMDLVFTDQAELAVRYPHIARDGDTLTAEVFCNALYDNKGAWVFAKAAPLHDQFGSIIGAIENIRDITERKRADIELNRQVSILNNSLDFIAAVDMQGIQIYVNLAGARMLGYDDPRELIGRRIKDMHSPEDALRVEQEAIPTAMREGLWRGENCLLRLDGTSLPVDQSIFVIRDAQGQPQAIATIMVDITERKQAEVEHERLASILESTTDLVAIADMEARLIYLNRAGRKMLGVGEDEDLGATRISDFTPHWAIETVLNKGVPTAIQEGSWSGEGAMLARDGHEVPVSQVIAVHRAADGTPQNLSTIARDITESKRAEESIRKNEARLKEAEEVGNVGSWDYDMTTDTLIWSDYTYRIYGRDPETFKVSFESVVAHYPPGDKEAVLEAFQKTIQNRTELTIEHRMITGNNETRFVFERGRVTYSEDGTPLRMIGSVVDITERKQAETELNRQVSILNNSRDFIAAVDMQGVHIYVNLAGARMLGYDDPRELIGRRIKDMHSPEDTLRVEQEGIPTAMREGIWRGQNRLLSLDGTSLPVDQSIFVIRDAQGQPQAIATIMVDITERQQAEAQIERTLRETRARYEVSQALAGAQTEEAVLDVLEQEAGRFYPEAMVMLVTFDRQGEDATLVLRRGNGFESGMVFNTPLGLRFPAERFPVVKLLSSDKPFITNDFLADHERFSDPAALEAVRRLGAASIAYFPLTIGSEWMGFINVVVKSAGYFDETKQHLYQMLAELGAAALQTAHLRDQIQDAMTRRGYQVQISTEISQEVASASELSDLFARVVTLTKERLGYYHTQLLRYDPTQDAVVLINGYGETGQKMLAEGHKLPMGSGLIGTAAASGQTVLRPTLAEDPDWQPNPLLPETKGEIAVPIKFQDKVLGVLDAQSNQAGALTEDDRLLLEGLCGQVAVAIDQTRLRQEMAERLEEVNRLYRSMSREGWKTYRDTADLPAGFMFDQTGIRPVDEAVLADEFFANIPMRVLGGEVVGTLTVANDPQHPTSPEDQTFLQQVSDQIALALESARLFEQTQSALAQTERLSEAGLRFSRAADLQELLTVVNEMIGIPLINRTLLGVFNYSSADELEGMDIVANWWAGSGHEPSEIGRHYSPETINLSLFISDAPVYYNDTFHDERVSGVTLELFTRQNIRSLAVLPLYLGSRQTGVLFLETEEAHNFTPDETRLFSALGPQIATVLENRRQFERARKQAERESTLNIISQKIQSATTVEAVLQIAARELGHALGAPMTIAQLSMKDKK